MLLLGYPCLVDAHLTLCVYPVRILTQPARMVHLDYCAGTHSVSLVGIFVENRRQFWTFCSPDTFVEPKE
jgi:hypothetical protein